MSDYETAYTLKKRAFYEHSTNTIRACPENYCLAHGGPGNWKAFDDHAMRQHWPAIERIIADYATGSTSEALATAIGKVIPK